MRESISVGLDEQSEILEELSKSINELYKQLDPVLIEEPPVNCATGKCDPEIPASNINRIVDLHSSRLKSSCNMINSLIKRINI